MSSPIPARMNEWTSAGDKETFKLINLTTEWLDSNLVIVFRGLFHSFPLIGAALSDKPSRRANVKESKRRRSYQFELVLPSNKKSVQGWKKRENKQSAKKSFARHELISAWQPERNYRRKS